MSPLDLNSVVKGYEGKWVALADNYSSVYGAGNTAKAAASQAKSKGHLEFTLFFVEKPNTLYCG